RVSAVAPLLVTRAKVSNGSRETGMFVLGGTPDVAALVPAGSMPSIGKVPLTDDGVGVVLGRGLASHLHAAPGDEVIVHASTGKTRLRVAGVVSSPVLDRINGGMVAAMPLVLAQQIFGRADRVDQIMVFAAP